MRLLHFVQTTDYVKWLFFVFAKVGKTDFRVIEKYFEIKSWSFMCFLLYKTNRLHVAVRLFSNRSKRTSKCGKNISDTLGYRLVCHFFVLTTRRITNWFTSCSSGNPWLNIVITWEELLLNDCKVYLVLLFWIFMLKNKLSFINKKTFPENVLA